MCECKIAVPQKARSGLTLSIRGCPTTLTIKYCLQMKACVKTARMPYAKVENFSTWSDFTILSSANRTLRNEKHRYMVKF